MEQARTYIAIDLKSFYASVECVERGLEPLDTCLVVADARRTEKTICLAVSPPLKKFGLKGRPRLFEVVSRMREVNRQRGHRGESFSEKEFADNPDIEVSYLVAPPRMALYIEYSKRIYQVYLRFFAPEDIHVYSIDEVFIDVTPYLKTYGTAAHDLAFNVIRNILSETGITATAGIGTNLYLAKVAMDIVAKKMSPDKDGVRIAELNEMDYRRQLWDHMPLADFWRVGRGTADRLRRYGILTMGDIARCSLTHEDFLYQLFGINAELLIDHAWGWEPVTMPQVKAYRPSTSSISSGQVLCCGYTFEKARTVVQEMIDTLSLDLVDKGVAARQIVITVGYDVASLNNLDIKIKYEGLTKVDWYGREVPRHAHGNVNFTQPTSSCVVMTEKVIELYDRIVDPDLLIRRLTISANKLVTENELKENNRRPIQLQLFTEETPAGILMKKNLEKEHRRQKAILKIKKMFGKNSILRGLNYRDGATQRDRNCQIGGHHE